MPLANGQIFTGYRIIRLLGSGGMGEVYLAQHPRLPRRDALKLLPHDWSADAEYRARFNREADLASTLWHPHIVGVHDRGEEDGQLWISMDFVDGLDAAKLLAERYPAGMPIEEVVRIVSAVASALDYAHKQGLLHRDVKPANIMMTHLDDEGEQRILLTDFGIARNVNEISGLTRTNMTVGTVAYSAPEQLLGEDIDGRADQYSLAATAYHLLTGSHLFPNSNPAVVISRHLNVPPPALASARPELTALDPAMTRALAKDPEDRFPRCSDFARALTHQIPASSPLAATVSSKPTSARRRIADAESAPTAPSPKNTAPRSRFRQRPTVIAASLGAAVLAVAVVFAWATWGRPRTDARVVKSATPTTIDASQVAAPPPPASSGPPPAPPTFTASAIDSLMLSPAEVRSLTEGVFHGVGEGQDMVVSNSSYGMSDNASQVRPPACVGVIFGAEHAVYSGAGYQEIRDQTLDPSSYTSGVQLEQTAIVFPTLDNAQASLASQTKQWQSCTKLPSGIPGSTGMQMGQRHGEGGYTWTLSDVSVQPNMITLKMAGYDNEAGSDQACQQALGVRANVLVKIRACQGITTTSVIFQDTSAAGNYGQVLAQAMLQRVAV
jgi:serine/threonine protein kinase